jgi:hypothetical protein
MVAQSVLMVAASQSQIGVTGFQSCGEINAVIFKACGVCVKTVGRFSSFGSVRLSNVESWKGSIKLFCQIVREYKRSLIACLSILQQVY